MNPFCKVFSRRWVDAVRRGIEKNLRNPSKYGESLKVSPNEGAYFNDYCNWRSIPEFTEYVHQSPAAAIVGQLMESSYSQFYHEHVLNKEPGTSKETPWHHDQSYYPIDGESLCSIWMPVDPVSIDSSIEFVKGSHRWGKWFHPRKFASAKNYPLADKQAKSERTYYDVPVSEIESGKWDILKWACEPGDCIVFHGLSVHGAKGNSSQTNHRRVLSTRWLGDGTVIAARPWEVSPPMSSELEVGQPTILCKDFPVVWKRDSQEQSSAWRKYV